MKDVLNELMEREHAGWRSLCEGTGGEFYGEIMVESAHMVLANGQVMSRAAVIESLEGAPPWSSYEIDDPMVTTVSDDVAALIYSGTGHREAGEDFSGIMTSVYVRHGSTWKLALHQQTAAF